ncbi:MAG: hypothetical protein LBK92_02320 [Endomicrobium sp.]|jgi:hypothetical protein|nr:hypothetical protein [Endomicrobium sp.]
MKLVMDMSMEREKANDLFPEGMQRVEILSAGVKKSKAGNDMLVAILLCVNSGEIGEFMFTMIKEKRWVLKSLLEATGIYQKDENGNYVFDTDNLKGKRAIAHVHNVEEEYIDRDLKQQKKKRSQIRRFLSIVSGSNGVGQEAAKEETADVEIPF